eukprot:03180.XXX_116046_116150_1 [CDS] Oithona nana genome sequencing.
MAAFVSSFPREFCLDLLPVSLHLHTPQQFPYFEA